MKNSWLAAILFLAFSGQTQSFSVDSMMQRSGSCGICCYNKETVESIQVNGVAILDGTKVLKEILVNGRLQATESTLNTVQVQGLVELKNCLVSGETNINGSLIADKTNFSEKLSVASKKITLTDCSASQIVIKEIAFFSGTQIVELRGDSCIKGSITVESGKGEVWLFSNSRVLGEVIGAQVIQK